jgi:hypothetical protein
MLQGRLSGHDDEHGDAGTDVTEGEGVGHLVEIFVNDERVASPLFPAGAGVATVKYSEPEWALVKAGKRTGFSFDADVEASIKQVEVLVLVAEVRT